MLRTEPHGALGGEAHCGREARCGGAAHPAAGAGRQDDLAIHTHLGFVTRRIGVQPRR